MRQTNKFCRIFCCLFSVCQRSFLRGYRVRGTVWFYSVFPKCSKHINNFNNTQIFRHLFCFFVLSVIFLHFPARKIRPICTTLVRRHPCPRTKKESRRLFATIPYHFKIPRFRYHEPFFDIPILRYTGISKKLSTIRYRISFNFQLSTYSTLFPCAS